MRVVLTEYTEYVIKFMCSRYNRKTAITHGTITCQVTKVRGYSTDLSKGSLEVPWTS